MFSISQLHNRFTGTVIGPEDPDYDQARTVFPGGIDRHPAVIIRVADAADVAQVIALAQETGLELSVRAGGHSAPGYGVNEGGVVLDLRALKDLEIDVAGRTAWAGAGLTAAEYTRAAAEHGLATGFGDTGTVGIAGITLAGGIGFLLRKHGMTIDNLLAAEIVTADGQILHTDEQSHPDLFWAIRGGGGNFGVVTRFKFRLHELPEIVGGMLMLPASPDVVTRFIALAEAAPDELSTICNVMTAPPMPFIPEQVRGKLVVMALMTYAGPADAGQDAVAPFRALATPIVDMVKPGQYQEMFFAPQDESFHPTAVSENMFIDTFDSGVAETIFKYLDMSDASMRAAQLRVLGAAMARVGGEATAFAHRNSRIMVNIAAFYEGPQEQPARQEWATAFRQALQQDNMGAYVGFLDGSERVHNAYPPSTWDRLAEVKRRYDPENLFHLNQNITAAAA